ncbi:hypothetical protein NECAME_07210, partial [Necator americanus]
QETRFLSRAVAAVFSSQLPLRIEGQDSCCCFSSQSLMSSQPIDVDCTDLAAFMTRLNALRKADDSVIIELNDALPTQSFHPVNSHATCKSVGERIRQIRAEFEVEEIIGARTRKAVDERCGKIF